MNVIGELLERAEIKGYLTTDDILDLLPEAEETLEQLEDIFISLHKAGVEVYNNSGDADAEEEQALRIKVNAY